MYLYLIILLCSIALPLSYSFESKIEFYKRWPALFTSIGIVGIFFIVWDMAFANLGVWRFNSEFIMGIYIYSLPIEECMFFIMIPFSCLFIYDSLKYFIKRDILRPYAKMISIVLFICLVVLAIPNQDRIYTFVTFILTAIFLAFHLVLFKDKFLGRFYTAYLVSLIPFFIVNGILTSYPVVLYNDSETLGIRLGTIPVEDTMYSLLLLLMNVSVYEYLISKKAVLKQKNLAKV